MLKIKREVGKLRVMIKSWIGLRLNCTFQSRAEGRKKGESAGGAGASHFRALNTTNTRISWSRD